MTAPRILIVDDEPDIVWAVSYTLADEGYEVHTAGNGTDGLAAAHQVHPDLVILDIMMPDINGIQLCHSLRRDQHLAAVPILFLSQRSSIADRINGLNDGADDYLIKPFDFGELKARISALLRRTGRGRGLSPTANISRLTYRDLCLDLRTHKVTVNKRTILLTPAEFELLRYLLTHRGVVFSSDQLLQQVWPDAHHSSDPSMVRWHVMNLRSKIEQNPAAPVYLRTVPRHGYMLGEPD